MKSYIIANWKLQGLRPEIQARARAFEAIESTHEIIVCPPVVYLAELARCWEKSPISLGAQNVSAEKSGAFTGEISADMLAELGCRYVLIGHSERRGLYLEDNALIARKVLSAYDAGLIPILCVGETLAEREAGRTLESIALQLTAAQVPVLVAYEPIWAIGTGKSATPQQVEEVHQAIKSWFSDKKISEPAVLYGGSVNPGNAQSLLSQPNVNGLLVGGASWDVQAFLQICQTEKG